MLDGESFLQGERKGQGERACRKKIQNQGAGNEKREETVGENLPDSLGGVIEDALDCDGVALLDGFGNMDEKLCESGVEITQTVDHHDHGNTEKCHHNAAEGGAYGVDHRGGGGEDGLATDHIITGNDVDHQGAGSGGIEDAAKGGQEGGDEDTGDGQQIKVGQNANSDHQKALHQVHTHHHPFAVAFVDDAAGEGGEEHGNEKGNGSHDAHEAVGAGFCIDPISDGDAVHQIAQGADHAGLQQKDVVFIPKFLMHGGHLVSAQMLP